MSPQRFTFHPVGILPSSESWKVEGKRSRIEGGRLQDESADSDCPISSLRLDPHWVEIDEPTLEDRPRKRLQRRIHPTVQLDLVVAEVGKDRRECLVCSESGNGQNRVCRSRAFD